LARPPQTSRVHRQPLVSMGQVCQCCSDRRDVEEISTVSAREEYAAFDKQPSASRHHAASDVSTRSPSSYASSQRTSSPRSETSEARSQPDDVRQISPLSELYPHVASEVVHEVVFDFELPSGLTKSVAMTERPLGMRIASQHPLNVTSVQIGGHAADLGVQIGWTLLNVGDVSVEACQTVEEVQRIMRLKAGSLPMKVSQVRDHQGRHCW